jgi:hypothetical protein
VLNFTDGRRSIHEIVRTVSAEFGPTDSAVMLRLMRDMERAGLVRLDRAR